MQSPSTSRFRCCGLLAAILAAGCGGTPTASAPALPLVAVSLPPLGWLVEQVGGEQMRVQVLIPPHRDPHSYEPSPTELARLTGAAVFFRVGHPGLTFETRVAEALSRQQQPMRVLSLADLTAEPRTIASDDPHLWLAPSVLSAGARRLAEALAELAPDRRAELQTRAEAFAERMQVLDGELRATFEQGGCRSFLVDHPAWSALALELGLQQLAIEEGGKEPGPATLSHLLELARAARIQRVFVEPGMPLQSSQAIARELGAEIVELDPLAPDVEANLRQTARQIATGCGHG